MSSAVLVRLRPTGPWRIGPDSGDRDRVDRVYHSDALYSAVCGAMFRLGEGGAWLDATARASSSASCALEFLFPVSCVDSVRGPSAKCVAASSVVENSLEGRAFCAFERGGNAACGQASERRCLRIDGPSECLLPDAAIRSVHLRTAGSIARGRRSRR